MSHRQPEVTPNGQQLARRSEDQGKIILRLRWHWSHGADGKVNAPFESGAAKLAVVAAFRLTLLTLSCDRMSVHGNAKA